MGHVVLATPSTSLDLVGDPPDGIYLVDFQAPVATNAYTLIEAPDAEGAEAVRFKPGNAKATGTIRIDRVNDTDAEFAAELDSLQALIAEANANPGTSTLTFQLPTDTGAIPNVECEVVSAQVTAFDTTNGSMLAKRRAEFTLEVEVKPWGKRVVETVSLWDLDVFNRDTFAEGRWRFDAGDATQLVITAGELVPGTVATVKRLYRPLRVDDFTATMKFRTGSTLTSSSFGLGKRIDASNYLVAEYDHASTDLRIRKVVATVESTLGTPANITTAGSTNHWLVFDIVANVVTANLYTTDPEEGGVAVATATHTLTAGDATQFGNDVFAYPYVRIRAGDTAFRYADYRLEVANTVEVSEPINDLTVRDVGGHVPAFAELTVTDADSTNRDSLEVGLQGKGFTRADPPPVLIDSDQLVTSGFSGAGSSAHAGAYDPLAAGNSSIVATTPPEVPTTICSTGAQEHVGRQRVKARVKGGITSGVGSQFRLAWRVGDGPIRYEPWRTPPVDNAWVDLPLAVIDIPPVSTGAQQWIGYVQVVTSALDTAVCDYVIVQPAEIFARARCADPTDPLAYDGRDTFIQSAGALDTKTADLGGNWDTNESLVDAADFAIETTLDKCRRTTTADAAGVGRVALLGSAVTDGGIQGDVAFSAVPAGATGAVYGVVGRYTSMTSKIVAGLYINGSLALFGVAKYNGSANPDFTVGILGADPDDPGSGFNSSPYFTVANVVYTISLDIAANGNWETSLRLNGTLVASHEGNDPVFATGGALASGRRGLYDEQVSATAVNRDYDNFASWVPEVDHLIFSGRSAILGGDYVSRQNSGGTFSGRPPFAGNYLRIPPGDSRLTTEVRRFDARRAADEGITGDPYKVGLVARERVLLT